MKKINRRSFLAFTSTVPIGFTLGAYASLARDKNQINPAELVDPWLEINTKNIAWNVKQVRKRISNRPIIAVIKCNGYGHGLVQMAKTLEAEGIQRFAVVKVYEAVALRDSGITGMILNFGPFSRKEAEQVVRYDITQSVYSETVTLLADAARRLNKRAQVHIKVDTGLGRVGVPYARALAYIEKVAAMPDIAIKGIFTTLIEEKDFDAIQVERLTRICEQAKKKGITVGVRHAASSLAVANSPGTFLDLVRPGNCLYGLEPLPNLELRQALSLKTRIIYIKNMRPGDTIGYHGKYKVKKNMLLATLPLGYENGYPFRSVDRAEVLIRGRRFPLIAYMSANNVFVDITGTKDIKIGEEVVLFGSQQGSSISLSEVAQWGESSVYKVAILMNPMMPRIYI